MLAHDRGDHNKKTPIIISSHDNPLFLFISWQPSRRRGSVPCTTPVCRASRTWCRCCLRTRPGCSSATARPRLRWSRRSYRSVMMIMMMIIIIIIMIMTMIMMMMMMDDDDDDHACTSPERGRPSTSHPIASLSLPPIHRTMLFADIEVHHTLCAGQEGQGWSTVFGIQTPCGGH
jgi:hypothetical protein